MPRPKQFTEAERRARLATTLGPQERAEALRRGATRAVARREAGLGDTPVVDELTQALVEHRWRELTARPNVSPEKLRELLKEIGAERKEVEEALLAVLKEARWEWRKRHEIKSDPSLPVIGGVQPTHGEMHATLTSGLKHAIALRDWRRSLPSGLLLNQTVPMTTPPPDEMAPTLGVVIERLAETLAALALQHEHKRLRGQQPGRRVAAQQAVRWLIWFMRRYAPDSPQAMRRKFLFGCMRELGITCPNLEEDPGDFAIWFDEAETFAGPATELKEPPAYL
jgi:hypothetical protein